MDEQKHRIVIVEDHPLVREHLVFLINKEPDMEVCGEADNIARALEIIQTTSPQLVIVDLTLKGGSGLDLIKNLKALSLQSPVLVFSMHEESLYAERALRAGAKGYITKNQGSKEVLAAVRRVLEGNLYVSDKMMSNVLAKLSSGGNSTLRPRPVDCLSDRELTVLEMIGRGLASRAIAESLNLGVPTVDTYRARIKEKLNIETAFELHDFAIRWLREGD